MACSKEVFEDGEFKSSQSEFNLERMSLMTCIFREKASNVRENSRATKTNKTSFPLEFDRFGQPKKDTQRVLSDAEFVLVVCLPERDHVKAINNLRIAWHEPGNSCTGIYTMLCTPAFLVPVNKQVPRGLRIL